MAYLYQISKGMAMHLNLPVCFVAEPLTETDKAFYLYGYGVTDEREMIKEIHVNTWFPKSKIISIENIDKKIDVPQDHPMLNRNKKERTATLFHTKQNNPFIKIQFPFNVDDIDRVRSLPDRRYNADDKSWYVPLSIETVEKLQKWNFTLDSRLQEFLRNAKLNINQVSRELTIPGLKGNLYPFQQQAVAFTEARKGRVLIADEMGLGKTIEALAWLQLHPELRPALVITPASLKLNWEREANRWLPQPNTQILSGSNPYPITGEIIIINYDLLQYWVQQIMAIKPKVIIFDEIHYIKNNNALRTKASKLIAKNVPHVIGLSGTPIINRPIEFYNAIKLINKTLFPSFWDYALTYCGAHNNGFGWDFSGASKTDELHEKLINTIMIRRTKREVMKELPEKIRSYIPLQIDNRDEYESAENDFISYLTKEKGVEVARHAANAETLTRIETLKQIAVKGKLQQVLEWIKDFLETNNKLVVFATHRFVINAIQSAFQDMAVKIDGSTPLRERQVAIDNFQNNPNIHLFIGNIQAAGVGITLTAASHAAIIELPWTPGALSQAEDRLHRIGQNEIVQIFYLLAYNTIEDKIAQILDKKQLILDAVIDGRQTESTSLLTEIINSYNSNSKYHEKD